MRTLYLLYHPKMIVSVLCIGPRELSQWVERSTLIVGLSGEYLDNYVAGWRGKCARKRSMFWKQGQVV